MGVGFDRLAPCFFGVDLKCEKMNFRQGHTFTCFLIVEHLNDKYFIRKWALQLLMAGRDSRYYFYGSQEPLWHWMMDEADVLLHPDPDDEKVAVTVGCRDIDDFVNELDICLNAGSSVPKYVFLLYDDVAVYREVLHRLGGCKAMSIGFQGSADLFIADGSGFLYLYTCCNLNFPETGDTAGDSEDGEIWISRDSLLEPEVHVKTRRLPSGRKKLIVKRILRWPPVGKLIAEGKITVRNASGTWQTENSVDRMAMRLINRILMDYQEKGTVPEHVSVYI